MLKRMGLLLLLMLLSSNLVFAQETELSEEELELVSYVSGAFEKLNNLESYALLGNITFSQALQMTIDGEIINLNNTGDGEVTNYITLNSMGETEALQTTTDIQLTMMLGDGEGLSFAVYSETILVDETLYVLKIQEMMGMDVTENPGWKVIAGDELEALMAETSEATGYNMNFLNINSLTNPTSPYNTNYFFPVNENTVRAIKEVGTEEINGQVMRVFEIEIYYAGLIDENLQQMIEMLDEETQDEMDFEALMDAFLSGYSVAQRIWIGQEDGLPHRVEMIQLINVDLTDIFSDMAETEGMEISTLLLDQKALVTTDLGEFNENFTITAPELHE